MSQSPEVCGTCGKRSKPTKNLLRCARCRLASYCDASCQKKAWPTHKLACVKGPSRAEAKGHDARQAEALRELRALGVLIKDRGFKPMDTLTAAERERLNMDFTLKSGRVVTATSGGVFPFALSELPDDFSLSFPIKEFLPELDYIIVETSVGQWIDVSGSQSPSNPTGFFASGSEERRALEDNVYKWGTQTRRLYKRMEQGMPEAVQLWEDYCTDVVILLRCLYREGVKLPTHVRSSVGGPRVAAAAADAQDSLFCLAKRDGHPEDHHAFVIRPGKYKPPSASRVHLAALCKAKIDKLTAARRTSG